MTSVLEGPHADMKKAHAANLAMSPSKRVRRMWFQIVIEMGCTQKMASSTASASTMKLM